MKCAVHSEADAVGFCRNCGKPMCSVCVRPVRDVLYCEDCLAGVIGLPPNAPQQATNPQAAPAAGDPAANYYTDPNVALPPHLDRVARWLIVTPQMHEIHHSEERGETDSNFGFNLPWWDRLFGTYRTTPAAGDDVVIGLPVFRDARERKLLRLLTQPFRRAH